MSLDDECNVVVNERAMAVAVLSNKREACDAVDQNVARLREEAATIRFQAEYEYKQALAHAAYLDRLANFQLSKDSIIELKGDEEMDDLDKAPVKARR